MDKLAHRKAKTTIQLLNKEGKPIGSQLVSVRQIRHEFLFGCGAFEVANIVNPKDEHDKEFYEERMTKWQEIFNYATLPFYLGQFETEQEKPQTKKLTLMAEWLRARDIVLKGHPLCWHTNTAKWLLGKDADEILRLQKYRIQREVSNFKGLIDMWDVINEVVIMPIFAKNENGITELCKKLGRVDMVKEMFAETRKYNSDALLLINDFNTSPAYERLIEACLEAGIKIDAIGIQSHQHQGYWGDEKLYDVLERYSRFGLPIHFTENTFISGELMPPEIVDLNDYQVKEWLTTVEGEERQARDVENFYRILFEDPNVEAITTWAFQDGAWLKAPAGFVREDNTTKPSFDAIKGLIKDEWWTRVETNTDENGRIEVSGFKGDYEIRLNDEVKRFSLPNTKIIHFL